ncbi:DUF4097 family beta strand repeat protein [candidate division KSB1 bacterium]|nr:DUF4097 family beta strand repeat protein [candidate division KSB1 bacterium]
MQKVMKISKLSLFFLVILCVATQMSLYAQTGRDIIILDGRLLKTYTLNSNGRFSIDNHNGRIEIESWDRNEVEIEVIERRGNRDERIEIEIVYSAERISVHTEYPDRNNISFNWFRRQNSRADYKIRVPRNVSLTSDSHNGDIRIREITGRVDASTHNGNVIIEEVTGDVSGETHNGDVDFRGINGEIEAQSHNGGITIEDSQSSGIRASTHNGRIRGNFTVDENGRYDFSSHNGGITLSIPDDSKFDLVAHARRNSFSSDFPYDDDRDRGRRNNRGNRATRFTGAINGGGASLRISTSNGSVRLRSY